MKTMMNVFKGRHAVRDFLDPGKHPYLPLVELPPELNPFLADRVRIHAKLMTFTPLGNIKALAGFNMLREADRRGELEGIKHAVENSSGNTARQIWQQTEGRIGVFSAGLGTTGTLIGNSRYLKRKKRSVQVVGVMREDGNYVPGVRTRNLLRLIRFDWRAHVDSVERIGTVDSYRRSLELSRRGIVVGPSSGFALAGLLQYLQRRKDEISLDALREPNGEVHCVFICCDGPVPYLDEYFKYLDASDFPPIHNESLLLNKPGQA